MVDELIKNWNGVRKDEKGKTRKKRWKKFNKKDAWTLDESCPEEIGRGLQGP